jgi:hypothetical protein
MITFFSSRVIGRDRSRTFVIVSAIAIFLAPCVCPAIWPDGYFQKLASVSLRLLRAHGPEAM